MNAEEISKVIDEYLASALTPEGHLVFGANHKGNSDAIFEQENSNYPAILLEMVARSPVAGTTTVTYQMIKAEDVALDEAWLKRMCEVWQTASTWVIYLGVLQNYLAKKFKKDDLSESTRIPLLTLMRHIRRGLISQEETEAIDKIIEQFSREDDTFPRITHPADTWTAKYLEILQTLEPEKVVTIQQLIEIASKANTVVPKKTLLKSALPLIEDNPEFVAMMREILPVIGEDGPVIVRDYEGTPFGRHDILHTGYSDILRGLIWMCHPYPELAEALHRVAKVCYRPDGQGPFNPKIGTACARALCLMGTAEAVGCLCSLQRTVRHASTRKQLDKAIDEAAKNSEVSVSEIEEISVSDCDLNGIGIHKVDIEKWQATLAIVNGKKVEITWAGPNDEVQKTIPATLKKKHGGSIRHLSKLKKKLIEEVATQRYRLDRLLMEDRLMDFAYWKKHYLEHLLVGHYARNLIWELDGSLFYIDRTSAPQDWQLKNISGKQIKPTESSKVKLWHPIDSPAKVVENWRNWLFKNEVLQPIKQAFREVYKLTDAERKTESYSNRFAAHIIKQHQFAALCKSKQWKYTLQGKWEGGSNPELDLSRFGYIARFIVEPCQQDIADSQAFLYLSTDQLRFYPSGIKDPQTIRLADIPVRILSETMRDVDMFTSVASVGNDPEWRDNGPADTHTYCSNFSFGELTASAESRRAVLEKILPAINGEGRFELDKKFLIVRGDIRTYKIHLGSSHILMEPNSQYLCIVKGPNKSLSKSVFLPFEDTTISLIISKALLLANDKKIRDKSIKSQIQPN